MIRWVRYFLRTYKMMPVLGFTAAVHRVSAGLRGRDDITTIKEVEKRDAESSIRTGKT